MRRTLTSLSTLAFAFALLATFSVTGKAQDYNTGDQTANLNDPRVTVLAPTGTVFVTSFPANLGLTFTVQHPELARTNVLNIDLTGPKGNVTTVLSVSGNPFSGSNGQYNPLDPVACNNQVFSPGVSCAVDNLTNTSGGFGPTATIAVPWIAVEPGTYTMTVSLKRQNDQGIETENVTISLIAVEYPAPPAVANAYINSMNIKLNAKQRGCVISRIAAGHTVEVYGNKGGPYDIAKIHNDVNAFLAGPCK